MNILNYIFHDGFFLSTSAADLVFDFWKEPDITPDVLPSFLRERDEDKPLYIFVSHHHKDHFTKQIISWQHLAKKAYYILSYDTARFIRHQLRPESSFKGEKLSPEQYTIMRPGDSFRDENIMVNAFGSTDIGCSFGVEVGGKNIFHAGDLNAWIWIEESTEAEVRAAIRDFMAILLTIKEKMPKLDVAMFPVDSRIGSSWWTGAKLFMEQLEVSRFVPMHFGLGENEEEIRQRIRDAFSPAAEILNKSCCQSAEYVGLLPGGILAFE